MLFLDQSIYVRWITVLKGYERPRDWILLWILDHMSHTLRQLHQNSFIIFGNIIDKQTYAFLVN